MLALSHIVVVVWQNSQFRSTQNMEPLSADVEPVCASNNKGFRLHYSRDRAGEILRLVQVYKCRCFTLRMVAPLKISERMNASLRFSQSGQPAGQTSPTKHAGEWQGILAADPVSEKDRAWRECQVSYCTFVRTFGVIYLFLVRDVCRPHAGHTPLTPVVLQEAWPTPTER
ncbi:hypothetical protein Mapa_013209 [Marchantia paleacea]|nr:hypothetical protein Mapa_013209 [Marchantia paleacea]